MTLVRRPPVPEVYIASVVEVIIRQLPTYSFTPASLKMAVPKDVVERPMPVDAATGS